MVRLFSRSRINLNLSNSSNMAGQQIKGRNFEVPGAGGFLLSGQADNLGEYYEDGREIVTYHSLDDLAEKAHYYLSHESERAKIAENGRIRTLAEHTWHHRFDQIFGAVGQRIAAAETAPAEPLSIEGARGFNFLSVLDWSQGWELLVRAYVEEFDADEDVAMIVRPISSEGLTVEQMAAQMDSFIENDLGFAPERTPDIIFEASPLAESRLPDLYRAAQCFVSPTRAVNDDPAWRMAAVVGLPIISRGGDGADTTHLRRSMRQAFSEFQNQVVAVDDLVGGLRA
jgi:hypothetical protein